MYTHGHAHTHMGWEKEKEKYSYAPSCRLTCQKYWYTERPNGARDYLRAETPVGRRCNDVILVQPESGEGCKTRAQRGARSIHLAPVRKRCFASEVFSCLLWDVAISPPSQNSQRVLSANVACILVVMIDNARHNYLRSILKPAFIIFKRCIVNNPVNMAE